MCGPDKSDGSGQTRRGRVETGMRHTMGLTHPDGRNAQVVPSLDAHTSVPKIPAEQRILD